MKKNSKVEKVITVKDINRDNITDFDIKPYLTAAEKDRYINLGLKNVILYDTQRGAAQLNAVLREWYLALVFCTAYLGIEIHVEADTGKIVDFTLDDYDHFVRNDVFGMVMSLKKSSITEIAENATKALEDFALFKKMFNVQITSTISSHNAISAMKHNEIRAAMIISENKKTLCEVVDSFTENIVNKIFESKEMERKSIEDMLDTFKANLEKIKEEIDTDATADGDLAEVAETK